MVVWCSPQDHTMQQQDERLLSCTHKTTEQNATMQTKYSEETSYKCEGQWCVSQDQTVQISQWSSLAPLHNQENTMSTKLFCKCPPEILVVWCVFITELYAKMSLFFNNPSQKHTWMASTMPTNTCQRKPLRSWWYGVHHKNTQYECSKDHHWDLVTNKNTEQVPYAHQHFWTKYLQMWQCEVCVSRDHTMQHLQR